MNWELLVLFWAWFFFGCIFLMVTRERVGSGVAFVMGAILWPVILMLDIYYMLWGRYEIRD
jgi:hypothetical protein